MPCSPAGTASLPASPLFLQPRGRGSQAFRRTWDSCLTTGLEGAAVLGAPRLQVPGEPADGRGAERGGGVGAADGAAGGHLGGAGGLRRARVPCTIMREEICAN